jgi:hypothetical protein
MTPLNLFTHEGLLYLYTSCGQIESLWFELTFNGKLTAHRLNNLHQFECLYHWNIDKNTIIRDSPSRPIEQSSSNLFKQENFLSLIKKRNYQTMFDSMTPFAQENNVQEELFFEINFATSCTIALRESCRYLVSSMHSIHNTNTIILCAPNHDSKISWMSLIQHQIDTLLSGSAVGAGDDANSPTRSPSPTSSDSSSPLSTVVAVDHSRQDMQSRTTTVTSIARGNGGLFQRSATTESILSHHSCYSSLGANLPPVDSANYDTLLLSPLHCQSSPILIRLFWHLTGPLQLIASPRYHVTGKPGACRSLSFIHLSVTEELELSGVPKGTTHSRFVFRYEGTSSPGIPSLPHITSPKSSSHWTWRA